MNAIRALLKDRRRSQRGGVLSGVLIMMAFIAILSGGLMTELTGNFLLSSNLVNRSLNEATVNSTMELALNQLETSPIGTGCPSLTPAQLNLNGRWAVPSYTSCWPAYREKVYSPIATSSSFNVDGAHSVLPNANPAQDLYVVGDSSGNVYQFPFGGSNPNWTRQLPGSVTGPPVTVQDASQYGHELITLVPFSPGSNPPSACTSGGCMAMLAQDSSNPPDALCYMGAGDKVISAAATGVKFPTVTFFGDRSGSLYAYTATESGNCTPRVKVVGNGQGVVAGPFVFAGPTNGSNTADEVYVVTSSSVLRYEYLEEQGEAPELNLMKTLSLPWSGVVGVALEKNTLPARLAVSFSNGQLAVVQLQSNFNMAVVSTAAVPSSIQGAPNWCHCSQPADQIAVGGTNGAIYLFDSGLNQIAASAAGGPAVLTTLATDSVGEWFYGDANGYVHEIQRPAGQSTMTEVATFGPVGGAISSALQVSSCASGICIYLAAQDGGAYRVPLDARDVVITTCISATVPACSGASPRLWAKIEIGREGYPNEVHVQGWSYYSI